MYRKMQKLTINPYTSCVIIFLGLIYLSFFKTYVSIMLGGISIFLVYYFMAIISLIIVKADTLRYPRIKGYLKGSCISFIIFLISYIIINQFVRLNTTYNTFIGLKIQTDVFQMLLIVPTLVIVGNILIDKNDIRKKKIHMYILMYFFINIIFTLNVLKQEPMAAKLLASGNINNKYMLQGASGFDIVYSLILIMPSLLYSFTVKRGSSRWLYLMGIGITILYIYKTSYITALLLLGVVFFIYIIFSIKFKWRILMSVPTLTILSLLINPTLVYILLINIAEKMPNYAMKVRFQDLANLVKYGDLSGESLGRIELYNQSIQAFIKSPIVGVFPYDRFANLSGHSTILDILGGTGLLGFSTFGCFLFCIYKTTVRYIDDISYYKVIKTTYIVFLILATINPIFSSPTILITLILIPNIRYISLKN